MILAVVAAFGGGAGGEGVLVVVVEPTTVEPVFAVAAGWDAGGLAPVLLVEAAAAAPVPPSAPQPASAIARLPIKPITGQACLIPKPPTHHFNAGQARDEVTNRGCTSVQLWVQLA